MILWRISRHHDLSGIGGLKANGRWHIVGRPVTYLSENPASALLEICVHTIEDDIPSDFILLRIEGPDVPITQVEEADLPREWVKNVDFTRELGDKWLRANAAVLLRIPSAIVPYTHNFLFNPLHPAAQAFSVIESISYPFDIGIKK